MTTASTSMIRFWRRLHDFRHRYGGAEQLLFFVAGFFFDALVVRRIDDGPVLIQQGVYLGMCGLLLGGLVAWPEQTPEPSRTRRVATRWAAPVLHFLLGTLLNAYALFYVKNASGVAAGIFFVMISALLFVNELPWFRRFGPVMVYALYSFCLTSYFAYLYPVLFGRLRAWMFVLAVGSSLVPLLLLSVFHHWWTGSGRHALRHAIVPSLGVQALLVVLFLLRLIPPVPLSLLDIGIYHDVTHDADGVYRLSHAAVAGWRFWIDDDREFHGRAGDRVYCFFRVFAPRNFHDEVRVQWAQRSPGGDWTANGSVPIAVVGGRDRGYAGYAYRQNWRRGEWRVSVETVDGREIGSRRFAITDDAGGDAERNFVVTTR